MKTVATALVSVFALGTAVHAADMAGGSARYGVYASRGDVIRFYDVEPGTVLRAYWAPPWDNRHYFPSTGKLPRYGRAENLNAPRRQHVRAESFYRAWGAASDVYAPPADVARVPYFPGVAQPAAPDAGEAPLLK